jgi:hypothetical protein
VRRPMVARPGRTAYSRGFPSNDRNTSIQIDFITPQSW